MHTFLHVAHGSITSRNMPPLLYLVLPLCGWRLNVGPPCMQAKYSMAEILFLPFLLKSTKLSRLVVNEPYNLSFIFLCLSIPSSAMNRPLSPSPAQHGYFALLNDSKSGEGKQLFSWCLFIPSMLSGMCEQRVFQKYTEPEACSCF